MKQLPTGEDILKGLWGSSALSYVMWFPPPFAFSSAWWCGSGILREVYGQEAASGCSVCRQVALGRDLPWSSHTEVKEDVEGGRTSNSTHSL